ncbi:MAG TPA: chemotaxis protein CheB [Polyangia bacterium]|nr:chemotaxis protein CheB [Polyangia bacterium]
MAARVDAIVIGGSSGALEALAALLPGIGSPGTVPIAIVVHLPPARPSRIPEVLAARAKLPVREAEDKEPAEPGIIYVAPPNYHLLVERGGTFALSDDEALHFSRPAIDALFESAADAYGGRLAGVLLSGASEDGAAGLAVIQRAGGVVIVQSPDDAVSRPMPEAALARLEPDHLLPAREIGPVLGSLT